MSSAYDHIEEAWGFEANPFSQTAIASGSEPYSTEVFPEETAEFQTKMIRGALQGGSPMGFLWSRGRGGDTGFGKTALMKRTVREINQDWGHGVQIATGMKEERIVPVVAAFSELNTLSRTGMYPVLFNAVLSTASGPDAPLLQARQKISEIVGDDGPAAIRDALTQARIRVAPTSSALRPDLLDIFSESHEELPEFLGSVSDAGQIRNGIQYLNFALIAFAAAGAQKVFLMVDQLEDLATNKALPAAKRRREIGRIRDLLEPSPTPRCCTSRSPSMQRPPPTWRPFGRRTAFPRSRTRPRIRVRWLSCTEWETTIRSKSFFGFGWSRIAMAPSRPIRSPRSSARC